MIFRRGCTLSTAGELATMRLVSKIWPVRNRRARRGNLPRKVCCLVCVHVVPQPVESWSNDATTGVNNVEEVVLSALTITSAFPV